MQDRQVPTTTAWASFLWPLGFVLIVAQLVGLAHTGQLGLYVAMAGAVLNVRGFFRNQHERERNAFILGRESVWQDHGRPR